MMPVANYSLISKAGSAIKKIYGDRLAKILLFGSYARNEQTSESDIDLLVVLKDDRISAGKELRLLNETLFKFGLDNDLSISAHPITETRYRNETSFFLNRVRQEEKER